MSLDEAKRFISRLTKEPSFREKIERDFVEHEINVINHEGFHCSHDELQ